MVRLYIGRHLMRLLQVQILWVMAWREVALDRFVRRIKGSLIVTTVMLTTCFKCVAHADVYVVANPSVDISAEEVRSVFIGDKLLATGVKLVPIDNAVAQEEFLRKVVSLELGDYNAIWTKKGFNDGLNPPDLKTSDSEVILYVRKTPGAIGYVRSLGTFTTGFKTIKRY